MTNIQKLRGTRIFKAYWDMRQRCTNPNRPQYPAYGGKGVTIADQWSTFDGFCADMLHRYNKHYEKHGTDTFLGRIDTSKSYTPENTRWVTRTRLSYNRRLKRTPKDTVREIRKDYLKTKSLRETGKNFSLARSKVGDIINKRGIYIYD
jgi:hypothetical protein